MDREQILRNQLENLSLQFAILVEKHITKAVRSLRYDLKKLTNSSDAPSEIVDSLQVIRPDNVSHQIYQEACETYTYPSRPQNLIYCPDCKGSVPASMSTGSCERGGFTVPDNINSNVNASVLAQHQPQYAKALKSYRPISGRSLRLHKGDKLKTKLESSDGEWRFGFKKTGFGLKKTWGFFRTGVVAKS